MHSRQPPESLSEQSEPAGVEPDGLEAGARVEGWRVLGRHAAGTFGVVYLAVRVGEEAAGPCALKLARSRGDARLGREVELLARVRHPNVPRLLGHGDWYGFPYVVMEWVAGAELYRWARLGNPSQRQVTRLLARLAGALDAVHAVGGAHRDMKGDNVLVRLSDGEPLLADLGAGTWEGAAPLTVSSPPGTPLYYSPERLRAHLNLLPPGAPSGAGPADDVYGLGVTAWRLLTDTYPFLELEEAQRTPERLRGRLPLAPHEMNPGVPPELSALVLRMMAAHPEERPPASEVARSLETLARAPAECWEGLLFAWETAPARLGPGRRLQSRVEYERMLTVARLEEEQTRVAAEVARVQAEHREPPRPETLPPLLPRRAAMRERRRAWPWSRVAGAALVLGALGTGVLKGVRQLSGEPLASVHLEEARNTSVEGDGGTVGVGDTALSSSTAAPSVAALANARPGLGLDLPRRPLPGQKRPPCRLRWEEEELNGGCWRQLTKVKPPCGEGEYEWQGACYLPVQAEASPATSEPP